MECDKCGKEESKIVRVEYIEAIDQFLCGACVTALEDGIEQHEINKRDRIARENEY